MELVDFVQAGNLSLFIINAILLLFLDIVDSGLNLRCQILFEHIQIVPFRLVFDPSHGFFFLFKDVDFLSGKLGLSTATEQE